LQNIREAMKENFPNCEKFAKNRRPTNKNFPKFSTAETGCFFVEFEELLRKWGNLKENLIAPPICSILTKKYLKLSLVWLLSYAARAVLEVQILAFLNIKMILFRL